MISSTSDTCVSDTVIRKLHVNINLYIYTYLECKCICEDVLLQLKVPLIETSLIEKNLANHASLDIQGSAKHALPSAA